MLAIRRFVRGSLTLADTGEQLFPLLCAINVPLTIALRRADHIRRPVNSCGLLLPGTRAGRHAGPHCDFSGPPGMNVGRFQGSGPRSCGRTWLMGPRVTMIRARAAPAEWNPYARLMIRRTRLFRPSCLALLMPSRTAASIPARRL